MITKLLLGLVFLIPLVHAQIISRSISVEDDLATVTLSMPATDEKYICVIDENIPSDLVSTKDYLRHGNTIRLYFSSAEPELTYKLKGLAGNYTVSGKYGCTGKHGSLSKTVQGTSFFTLGDMQREGLHPMGTVVIFGLVILIVYGVISGKK